MWLFRRVVPLIEVIEISAAANLRVEMENVILVNAATANRVTNALRMKLNKGKLNGIRPSDIVGTIAFHANIPGYTIGKIRIEDKFTYVDVPEALVEKVLKHNGNYRIGKDKFTLVKS